MSVFFKGTRALIRKLLFCLVAITSAGYSALRASEALAADKSPSRAVSMVVAFGPGTFTDVITRLIAEHLQRAFGSPFVVENKPGAGGTIGSGTVARAQPNGLTLLTATNGTISVVKSLYSNVPYDPDRDFEPVARVARMSSMVVVNSSLPIATPGELVAYARSNPGRFRYGYGNSTGVIAGETLKQALGLDMTAVPYRGNPQALIDVMNGNIEGMIVDLQSGAVQIRANKVRTIATVGPKRSSLFPDVPTLHETVIPGFASGGWTGILAPAGTPRDILMQLGEEIRKFTLRADVKEKMLAALVEIDYAGPEEFATFLKSESSRWTAMATAAKIKPE